MICPMKYSSTTLHKDGALVAGAGCQCERSECAWWAERETSDGETVSGCSVQLLVRGSR